MDELQKRSAEAGRTCCSTSRTTNYGETVVYRSGGARIAAQHGAVGMFLRSVGPMGLRTTHTGGMQYGDEAAKIPLPPSPSKTHSASSASLPAAGACVSA